MALLFAQSHVQWSPQPNPRDGYWTSQASEIIPLLDSHKLAPVVKGSWEERIAAAGQTSLAYHVNFTPQAPLGLYTLTSPKGDILIARFADGWLWDEPSQISLVLEVKPELFDDPRAMSRYCEEKFRWQMVSGLTLSKLNSNRFAGVFDRMLESQFFFGRASWVVGLRQNSQVYLVFSAVKLGMSPEYPADAKFIAERFPPLRSRTGGYTKEQLLTLLDKPCFPPPFLTSRIAIGELLSRGLLSDSEIRAIAARRSWEFAVALDERHLEAKYAGPLLEFFLTSNEYGDWMRPFRVREFFAHLKKNKVDVAPWAFEFLKRGRYMDTVLEYLVNPPQSPSKESLIRIVQ